jgi:hypothetical protein
MHLVVVQGSIELPHKGLILLAKGGQVKVSCKWWINYLIKLSLLRLWPWPWAKGGLTCIAAAAMTLWQ